MTFKTKTYYLSDLAEINWGNTSITKSSYTSDGFVAYSASGHDGLLPEFEHERVAIIVSAIGANCGKTWLAEGKWTAIKNTITIWSNSSLLDTRYLYYITKRKNFFPTRGSAQPFISQADARAVEIEIPTIEDQIAISNILENLDKKLSQNKKVNKNLEEISKTIFKSWFIDFDPVLAKQNNLSTDLPREISDLFPDSFDELKLDKIPQDWKKLPLKELSNYLSRGISPKYCEKENGVSVINQKCIRNDAIDFSKARYHNPLLKKIEGREIQKYDCLINSTGVGTLGRVAMVPELEEEAVIVDSHVTIVRGKNTEQAFYLSMLLLQRQKEIESLGEGSTGQTELSRKIIGDLEIIFPSEKLIKQFFISISPLLEKKWLNEKISDNLQQLKFKLLPKLISGEIKVPNAKEMIGEVLI